MGEFKRVIYASFILLVIVVSSSIFVVGSLDNTSKNYLATDLSITIELDQPSRRVRYYNDFLFVSAHDTTNDWVVFFYVIDVSNPYTPGEPLLLFNLTGYPPDYLWEFQIMDNYLFIFGSIEYGTIAVFDISNPSIPILVSQVTLDGFHYFKSNYIKNHMLYALGANYTAANGISFLAINIVNPFSPQLVHISNSSILNNPNDIQLLYQECLFVSHGHTIDVYNLISLEDIALVTHIYLEFLLHIKDLVLFDNYLYITCANSYDRGEIHVVNISDLSNPEIVDEIEVWTTSCRSMVATNDTIFITGFSKIHVFEILAPGELGEEIVYELSLDYYVTLSSITIDDAMEFIFICGGGVHIVEIADITNQIFIHYPTILVSSVMILYIISYLRKKKHKE